MHRKLRKVNIDDCGNIKIANVFLADPPPPHPTLRDEVKRSEFNFFQNMGMLHNKLKGMMHATTW